MLNSSCCFFWVFLWTLFSFPLSNTEWSLWWVCPSLRSLHAGDARCSRTPHHPHVSCSRADGHPRHASHRPPLRSPRLQPQSWREWLRPSALPCLFPLHLEWPTPCLYEGSFSAPASMHKFIFSKYSPCQQKASLHTTALHSDWSERVDLIL